MAQRPDSDLPDPVNPSRRGREVAEVTADVPPADVLAPREGERFGDGTPRAGVAVAEGKQWFGHPRGLSTLFMTEMWERFSYYGGRALLILYMTDAVVSGGLGMTVAEAGALYALYTSVVYMTNLPGGWIADKFIGARNAVFYGGIIIAIGNACLATGVSTLFYVGLALIALGTGLLKPNVSTMVGSLYAKDDARRDAGFSIFYMGINLGAFMAPLIAGYLGQNIAWRWGFAAVTVGMILGLIQYKLGAKHLGTAGMKEEAKTAEEAASRRRSLMIGLGVVAALVAIPLLVGAMGLAEVGVEWVSNMVGIILLVLPVAYFAVLFLTGQWSGEERGRIVAIIVFYIAAALFWSSFEQAGTTLTLFADRHTDNSVAGADFPSTWWQSVNALFIIALAPVFAWLWVWLSRRRREPSTPLKFSLGLLLVGLGFLLLVPAAFMVQDGGEGTRVGPQWLLGIYFLHTLGELCLSPVGLSAMTKLAPERIVGQMMGIWFLGAATGNYIGGRVGGLFESYPLSGIFLAVFATSAAAGLVMLLITPWVKKLMSSPD
jgi:POT family proton-dependent oligopeptide transporter